MADQERECTILGDGGRAVRLVLDRIGDTWTLLVVSTLAAGPLRFSELQRRVPGVSQRMLTRTLKGLRRDGLVTRTSYPEVPPRVEYELTDVGASLIEPAAGLARWAQANSSRIASSRAAADASSV